MHKLLLVVAFSFALLSGCVARETRDHVQGQVEIHDRYVALIESSITATSHDPADNVTSDQLALTPEPVRRLLQRAIVALYLSRSSYYTLWFTLGDGPDPKTLPVPLSTPIVFDPSALAPVGSGQ
jgi:hypothetical protein